MIKECEDKTSVHTVPDKCPKTGQFSVVWEYDHRIWSGTYKWVNANLYIYNRNTNEYDLVNEGSGYPWMNGDPLKAKFFTCIN